MAAWRSSQLFSDYFVNRGNGAQSWPALYSSDGSEGIGRAFFCTLVNRRIVILHEFIKKTQETPTHELAIAQKRMKEAKRGKNT